MKMSFTAKLRGPGGNVIVPLFTNQDGSKRSTFEFPSLADGLEATIPFLRQMEQNQLGLVITELTVMEVK